MYDKLRTLRESKSKDDRGFTLIELLVVVVIIGILVAIAIPIYLNYQDDAHDKSVKSDIRNAVTAIEACYSKANDFPDEVIKAVANTELKVDSASCNETLVVSSGNVITYTPPTSTGTEFTVEGWHGAAEDTTKDNDHTYYSKTGQMDNDGSGGTDSE